MALKIRRAIDSAAPGARSRLLRPALLALACLAAPALAGYGEPLAAVAQILDRAEALEPLETVVVAHRGSIVAERGYRGHSPSAPASIMSASKSVISALVGIAIDKGVLEGPDQPIAPLLAGDMPSKPDPRLGEITIGHLLSMQAGLESTSGARYGAWVSSGNWVRAALAQPFEDEPGGRMIYSTGSSHLLSAILTRRTSRSTLRLARDWLGALDGFAISAWERDPGHKPRHAKTYRNFAAEYERLQSERIAAFREFIADVNSGAYPERSHGVPIANEEFERFRAAIES